MDFPGFRADLRFVFVAALLAVLSGLAANWVRTDPLPLLPSLPEERLVRGLGDLPTGVVNKTPELVDLDTAIAALDEDQVLFVDAREEAFFDLGRIPGARSLPRQSFRADFRGFSKAVDRGLPLIVYCSEEDCVDSLIVAKALMLLGYENVSVFGGGWTEWEAAGMPREP